MLRSHACPIWFVSICELRVEASCIENLYKTPLVRRAVFVLSSGGFGGVGEGFGEGDFQEVVFIVVQWEEVHRLGADFDQSRRRDWREQGDYFGALTASAPAMVK